MSHIEVEKSNSVLKVRLNRPKARNAFNEEMIAEMTEAFSSVDADVRVLALEGSGESFCAGGDLNWMKSMVDFSEQENRQDSEKLYEMYEALKNVPVPVVTRVQGHAMGGALGLIACSDVVFAEEETQFCFSEVRLGLAPAVISAFVKDKILPRDMHRFFLTAEVFEAGEAFDMGLIHGYGSEKEVKQTTDRVIKKIVNNGPLAVRATKMLISKLGDSDDLKNQTSQLIAALRVGAEGQEGLSAFFEKRKPSWMEG